MTASATPETPPTLDECVDTLVREWLQVKGPMTLAYNRNLVRAGLLDAIGALTETPRLHEDGDPAYARRLGVGAPMGIQP